LTSDNGFDDIDKDTELQEILKGKPLIKVATKKDINHNTKEADIAICSLKDDLTPLISLMLNKLNLDKKEESNFLGTREEEFLENISNQLEVARQAISDTHQIDIVSDNIRVAINLLNDLMGNSESKTMEDIYNTLFSKFCLGK